jgi:hypothetical protein
MEPNWAAEHLQTIRTLMERTALYRRAIGPVSIVVGIIGIAASIIGQCFRVGYENLFFAPYWLAVAVIALAASLLLVRRQALSQGEAFWSSPARRVAQAMFPGLFAGFTAGVIYFFAVHGLDALPILLAVLISAWTICYGLALHSASFFMPRRVRWFAWVFVILGLLIGLEFTVLHWVPLKVFGFFGFHGLMGLTFGLTHLIFGISSLLTESRSQTA